MKTNKLQFQQNSPQQVRYNNNHSRSYSIIISHTVSQILEMDNKYQYINQDCNYYLYNQDSLIFNHKITVKTNNDFKWKMLQILIQQLESIPYHQQQTNYYSLTTNNYGDKLAGNHKYFAYRLYLQPYNRVYNQIQHYYYNQNYQIQQQIIDQSICVLVIGNSNSINQDILAKLLQSISNQDYQNYLIHIYLMGSSVNIKYILNSLGNLKRKVKYKMTIWPVSQLSVLEMRNKIIRHSCEESDLIVDIPIQGELIGRQVFSLLSKFYTTNSRDYFIYSPSLQIVNHTQSIAQADSSQVQETEFQNKNMRKNLNIMSVRSFRVSEYLKLDQTLIFLIFDQKKWSVEESDLYFYTMLMEEWGFKHIRFLEQYLYFKKQPRIPKIISTNFLRVWLPVNTDVEEIHKRYYTQMNRQVEKESIPENIQFLYNLNKVTKFYLKTKDPKISGIQIIEKPENKTELIQKIAFAYSLWKYSHNQIFALGEKYYYQSKYLDVSNIAELPFCIVVDGQLPSLEAGSNQSEWNTKNDYGHFLSSIARLDYLNFKIILTFSQPIQEIRKKQVTSFISKNYPFLSQKITLLFSKDHIPNAKNKHETISQYCMEKDYIIPLQTSCQFIGRQPLKLINYFLQQKNPDLDKSKLFYLSHLSINVFYEMKFDQIQANNVGFEKQFSMKRHLVKLNHQMYFNNYYPFIFEKSLFNQIPIKYLCPTKQSCYGQLADGFIYQALLKLANGLIQYNDEILLNNPRGNFAVQSREELIKLEDMATDQKIIKKSIALK